MTLIENLEKAKDVVDQLIN